MLLDATSADLAVMNTTGIRADLLAGPVSEDDLVRVLPFSDELVTLQLSGDELTRAMRGAAMESCRGGDPSPFQMAGGRVAVGCDAGSFDLTIRSRGVTPAGSYRIVAPSFLTEAGRWLDLPTRGPEPTGVAARDAVLAQVIARPACSEPTANPLPCVVAEADGRIDWQ
jgi:2',3'-cyclic-nucleotide 2'-phosphodiesterase (5'-nucleotidase family)